MVGLTSCVCPKNADGTKNGPCKYVGPAITGTVSFNNVGLSITAWGEGVKPTAPLEVPSTLVGIPVNTK